VSRRLFQYHPVIGYHFIPHLKARVEHEGGGYLLQSNGAGFRCRHEFSNSKPPGSYRVLLFGDSYTAGSAVSDKFRYGDLLERLLPGVQVFNFGIPGTGTDQHYLAWRELGRGIDHDLLVIAIQVENIRRVTAQRRPYRTPDGEPLIMYKPYFDLAPDGSLKLHQVPVPKEFTRPGVLPDELMRSTVLGISNSWLRGAMGWMGPQVKDVVQRLIRFQPLPEYDSPSSAEWRLLEAILRQWISEARTPVILFLVPTHHYVEGFASPAAYQARFRSLESPPRVIVHDPLPSYSHLSRSERRRLRFEHDTHPTPAAHLLLAQSLSRCIAQFMQAAQEGDRRCLV
jgi:GDSL-like Lipase/Acylhydrolase family